MIDIDFKEKTKTLMTALKAFVLTMVWATMATSFAFCKNYSFENFEVILSKASNARLTHLK
jgi:hypothetical protein